MLKDYWRKSHELFSKDKQANEISDFARFAADYFPNQGKLLDLGAGRGQDSRYFSKLGYDVTAVDISDLGLKIFRDLNKEDELNIELLEVDISNGLPFEDNSFDIVYARYSLHYFSNEKTKGIFREIIRVLRPEGIFACLLNSTEDEKANDSECEMIEKNYYKSKSGLLTRYFSFEYFKEIIKDLFLPIILDKGSEDFKSGTKKFIRFIGRK